MRLGKEPVTTQLGKLAQARRSGVLWLPGDDNGAIRLYHGEVTGAESPRIPDLASRLARWSAEPGRRESAPSELERDWVAREAIADAAADLLAMAPRAGRFTDGGGPGPDGAGAMTVGELLAEVSRRREISRQLSACVTADSVVGRDPRFRGGGAHIPASQWALLVRMNGPVTPRGLAMERGRSVFTTTLEVFRLITVGLVAVADGQPPDGQAISFIRATAG
jgi:hypothetical protein